MRQWEWVKRLVYIAPVYTPDRFAAKREGGPKSVLRPSRDARSSLPKDHSDI